MNTRKDRKTGGELSAKAMADTTKYDALEVGHAMTEDIEAELMKSVQIYKPMINEDEFCVVMVIATDPLIKNLIRRKFYCWPYLPSPRPNQSVFLYNKRLDKIVKRLWVLPSPMVMAELVSLPVVHKRYHTMQAWSMAFYKGTFWEYVRYDQKINMPSEQEYLAEHRDELVKAGCKIPSTDVREEFDFTKIHIKNIVDTVEPVSAQKSDSLILQT
jgi:hypothetical protein